MRCCAKLSFTIVQPILRGFLCGKDYATERAGQIALETTRWETLQSLSGSVTDTFTKCWEAAAKAALEILKESERRFEKLEDNTRKLIEADQLAAADINQPLAQLAAQRIERIAAEQKFYAALQFLKLSMGYVYRARSEFVVLCCAKAPGLNRS